MLLVACILSLIFGSIGFVVTKNNARYILSGYNTMSEQERQLVNIDRYVPFFKRFHVFLALSLLVGVCLLNLKDANWASLFMTIYPLVAYLYFLIKGSSYFAGSSQQKFGTYLTGGILIIGVVVLLRSGFTDYRSSEMTLNGQTLTIDGAYGITLSRQDILDQKLVGQLPPIAYKANGFAAGDYAKGRFKTKDGQTIWLFVNKTSGPFLQVKTKNGDLYYNHDTLSARLLSRNVEKWLKTTRSISVADKAAIPLPN